MKYFQALEKRIAKRYTRDEDFAKVLGKQSAGCFSGFNTFKSSLHFLYQPYQPFSFTECSRVSWNTMSGQRSCVKFKFTRLGAR